MLPLNIIWPLRQLGNFFWLQLTASCPASDHLTLHHYLLSPRLSLSTSPLSLSFRSKKKFLPMFYADLYSYSLCISLKSHHCLLDANDTVEKSDIFWFFVYDLLFFSASFKNFQLSVFSNASSLLPFVFHSPFGTPISNMLTFYYFLTLSGRIPSLDFSAHEIVFQWNPP